MRILIATDAWAPQTNGVVSTLGQTIGHLRRFGHQVELLTPQQFRTAPCPGYDEIRLALGVTTGVVRCFEHFAPQAVHIATEGPIGHAVRRFCCRNGLDFTTSYHTRFPEYLRERAPVPLSLSYTLLRRFHSPAVHCMVSTASMHRHLARRGFDNLARWRRGVDAALFRPYGKDMLDLPRPIAACVGRVAVEKNIEAFLSMPWKGSKLVIGDGPERARLARQYPDVHFAGFRHGSDLARHLAAADVMVFPSLTDTFGLVMLEALACGVPVAAYPVTGPVDVIEDGQTGALDADLARAARRALALSPEHCRAWAESQDWRSCTREFEALLAPSGL